MLKFKCKIPAPKG